MHNLYKYPAFTLIFIIFSSSVNTVFADKTTRSTGKQFTNATPYTWYDGKRNKTIWLNPKLIAEFEPKPEGHRQTKDLAANATRVNVKQHTIRLWRLKTGNTSKPAMQQLRQGIPAVKVSPVLHDGPSETSRKRALPGNIIVHLDPDWDPQRVKAWFKEQSLEVVKPLNIGPNIFIVKTGAGLESLEKANELYTSRKVIAAYPDWWQEVSKR